MRRKAPAGLRGKRGSDLRKNLTAEQLEWIGSVAIAWNELEFELDITMAVALGISPPLWFEVTTRINGIEGKLQLIRKVGVLFPEIDHAIFGSINQTLDAIAESKKFRDAVIHAHVLDAPSGIGALVQRRAREEIVLLKADALKGLYQRLAMLREEMLPAHLILSHLALYLRFHPKPDDASRTPAEKEAQVYASQLRSRQSDRRSLPPLPQFPELSQDPRATAE
jgi:hypothetical protein